MSHNCTNLVNACKLSINNRSWLSQLNFINFNTFNVRSYNSASNNSFSIFFFYILHFEFHEEKNLTIYRSRATNFNNLANPFLCGVWSSAFERFIFFKKKLRVGCIFCDGHWDSSKNDIQKTPSLIIQYGAHVIPIRELSTE